MSSYDMLGDYRRFNPDKFKERAPLVPWEDPYAKACYKRYSERTERQVREAASALGIPVANKLKDQLCREITERKLGRQWEQLGWKARVSNTKRLHQQNEFRALLLALEFWYTSVVHMAIFLGRLHGVRVVTEKDVEVSLNLTLECQEDQERTFPITVKLTPDTEDFQRYSVQVAGPQSFLKSAIIDLLSPAGRVKRTSLETANSPGDALVRLQLPNPDEAVQLLVHLTTLPETVGIQSVQFCYTLKASTHPLLALVPSQKKRHTECRSLPPLTSQLLLGGTEEERSERAEQRSQLQQELGKGMVEQLLDIEYPLHPGPYTRGQVQRHKRLVAPYESLLATSNQMYLSDAAAEDLAQQYLGPDPQAFYEQLAKISTKPLPTVIRDLDDYVKQGRWKMFLEKMERLANPIS